MDLTLLSEAFYEGFSADERLNEEGIPGCINIKFRADPLYFELEVFC